MNPQQQTYDWPQYPSQDQQPYQPPGKRSSHKRPIIIAIVLLLAIVAAGVLFATSSKEKQQAAKPCLTPGDLARITGDNVLVAPFDPRVSFYDTSFEFEENKAKPLAKEKQITQIEITKIARFYTKHAETKPIRIQLITTESATASSKVAQARLGLVKKYLTEAGVPSDQITQEIIKHEYNSDEEYPDGLDLVLLKLLSEPSCQIIP